MIERQKKDKLCNLSLLFATPPPPPLQSIKYVFYSDLSVASLGFVPCKETNKTSRQLKSACNHSQQRKHQKEERASQWPMATLDVNFS